MERMAEAIASSNHHNLFVEVNKIKGNDNILISMSLQYLM